MARLAHQVGQRRAILAADGEQAAAQRMTGDAASRPASVAACLISRATVLSDKMIRSTLVTSQNSDRSVRDARFRIEQLRIGHRHLARTSVLRPQTTYRTEPLPPSREIVSCAAHRPEMQRVANRSAPNRRGSGSLFL